MSNRKERRKGLVKRKYLKSFRFYLKTNFPNIFQEFHYIANDTFEADFKSALEFFANRFKNTLDRNYIIHINKLYDLNMIHKKYMNRNKHRLLA